MARKSSARRVATAPGVPEVLKFSSPKLIAPEESVILPLAKVKLPTAEPVAAVSTHNPKYLKYSVLITEANRPGGVRNTTVSKRRVAQGDPLAALITPLIAALPVTASL